MAEWLDLLHNSADEVSGCTGEIKEIAYLLKKVGLTKLAGELLDIAFYLDKTREDIRKATSLKTDQDMKDATNMTATMLNALVAGGELVKKGKIED